MSPGGTTAQWRAVLRALAARRSQRWALWTLAALVAASVLVPLVSPRDYLTPDWQHILRPPSVAAPFGTDGLGRDLLVRAFWG